MVKVKIGLEIHVYLRMEETQRKLFCNCLIDTDAKPNVNTCPICTGQPGCKPMLANREAIDKITAVALMLGCTMNKSLMFQRKHYSWPDLPNGYQKTMSGSYSVPTGENGKFEGIGITEIHLEEDPAKWDPLTGNVDYNRCGLPLAEIVTEPDFKDVGELREWLKKLRTTLEYIKAVDGDSGVKCDTNVSIGPKFERVEIKNVNSFSGIVGAASYEIERQMGEVKKGNRIPQETRTWDDAKGETIFMRSKETAQDYMFIPDPDLPLITIDDEYIKKIKDSLPEKPQEKIDKFLERGVEEIDAQVLASERKLAEIFEEVSEKIDPIVAARWLRRELLRVVNYNKKKMEDVKINPKHIIEILEMSESKEISDKVSRGIIEKLIETDFSPKEYVKKEGLGMVSDSGELEVFCKEVIDSNPQAVEDVKAGNEKSINFLVGQVMRKTKGKSSPHELAELFKKLIP